ncbi:MAG: hypothetical protein K9H41_05715 [Bacteroidia bacterium]|nr:hypothetical protein [Bacteroidia bacterium]
MKKIVVILFSLLLVSFSFLYKDNVSLNLSYTLNYKDDSWHKQRTGFLWALSYLGADLPKGSFDKYIEWIDSSSFEINFNSLGFDEHALNELKSITDSIKNTPYYIKHHSIDVGHFIALTIGSSPHYYAITNIPENYGQFLASHEFEDPIVFSVTKSSVAKHHRVVKCKIHKSVLKTAFIAEEGSGEINSNFIPEFFETMDIMKNGQLRFAIYNANGSLVNASPVEFGNAGKPAKCMWCHEIVIQPLFIKTDSVANSISPREFQKLAESQNMILNVYRKTLNSEINFDMKQYHTLMELLYISYMEPSIKKLSKEWDISEKDIRVILNQQTTHHHSEFSFFDSVYYRAGIERYAPSKCIKVADDIREPSIYEPMFINGK